MASMNDVAKKAGVSVATVSNVINRTRPVSEELEERVKKAIKELDYRVNPMARSLKSGRTRNIGVILPKITSPFFTDVLDGIEEASKKFNYRTTYLSSGYDMDTEREYVEVLKADWVDGIIMDSCCDVNQELEYSKYLSSLSYSNKKIPIVSIERRLDSNLINSVVIDEELYAYKAVKYLLDLGHKKIVHISGPRHLPMVKNICKGYKQALSEVGIEVDERLILEGDYTTLSGYKSMIKALNERYDFSAVFACNDQSAVGAMKAVKEWSYKIPEDIAIVGFDNIYASTLVEPSITTVNIPRYAMGYKALELLVRHMKHSNRKPETIILDCNLIIRQSTDVKGDNSWNLIDW